MIDSQKIPPEPNLRGHQDQIYQPLTAKDEIRLLALEPGQNNEDITCSLVNASLTWRAQYEALSYTWDVLTLQSP